MRERYADRRRKERDGTREGRLETETGRYSYTFINRETTQRYLPGQVTLSYRHRR